MSERSVTEWIRELKEGEDQAAKRLWDRYFSRLVACARKRLRNVPRRSFDEEDVAQSVFLSLCRGAEQGRFPKLNNRDDLWQLLVMLTRDKVVNQVRRNTRKKRGGGLVRGDSIFRGTEGDRAGFDVFLGQAPDPKFLAALDEQYHRLLQALRTDDQRRVAELRLEGYSNDEIAAQLGVTTRSIERKLKIIRTQWTKELGEDAE